jgi:hypothetical protein
MCRSIVYEESSLIRSTIPIFSVFTLPDACLTSLCGCPDSIRELRHLEHSIQVIGSFVVCLKGGTDECPMNQRHRLYVGGGVGGFNGKKDNG